MIDRFLVEKTHAHLNYDGGPRRVREEARESRGRRMTETVQTVCRARYSRDGLIYIYPLSWTMCARSRNATEKLSY